MAKTTPTAGGIGQLGELRQRILFVLGAIVVFRLGTHIPIPGVDPAAVAALFAQTRGSIIDVFNMFSGGALERLSIFALGVMPYISASIIIQMMSSVIPQLEQLKKEGEAGRRKITRYTRYGTLVLATFQALGISIAIESQVAGGGPVVLIPARGTDYRTRYWQRHFPGDLRQHRRRFARSGCRNPRVGAHGHVFADRRHYAVRGRNRRHGFRGLRRARSAASDGELCQATARSAHDGRTKFAPAVEAEHVRRHSTDLRFQYHPVPGQSRKLVWTSRRNGMAA